MENVYDLVILGGGTAGLTAASFARGVGADAALIERDRTGGDCTWTGCVPSKTLLNVARVAHEARRASRLGLTIAASEVDLASVMKHVRAVVQATYEEETLEALRERGTDVFLGEARFESPHTVVVDGTRIKGRSLLVATGARPALPSIEGLDDVPYLTTDTLWDLTTLPDRLVVVGGGPVGCEMAQAFSRLGAEVTLIQSRDRLLPRDEPEASQGLLEIFRGEGISVRLESRVRRVWQDAAGIHAEAGGEEVVGDALLIAVGRRPSVEALDLEKAGVAFDEGGIHVDGKLRTSQPHVFAAGDCLGSHQFSHYAGWQAAIAVRNALLPLSSAGVRTHVPWTTFTDPEVAHAGLTETQAQETQGDEVETTTWPMSKVDRARAVGETDGFVKLVHRGGTVVGVTIVSPAAGELIQEWIYVLDHGLGLRDVATAIHVYPSLSRANAQVAGELVVSRLLDGSVGRIVKPILKHLLRWMRWRRSF